MLRKLIVIKAHKVSNHLLVSDYKFYEVKDSLIDYPPCECWWQLAREKCIRAHEWLFTIVKCYRTQLR
jgi:hypothetical protein